MRPSRTSSTDLNHGDVFPFAQPQCPAHAYSVAVGWAQHNFKGFEMHYRNGREAKNGDKIIQIDNGKVSALGVLHSAVAGNDYCNGSIAIIQQSHTACLVDCLHLDDVNAMLAEKGLDKRPAGK